MSVYLDRALWRFGMCIWAAALVRGAKNDLRRRSKPLKDRPPPPPPKPRVVQPPKPHKEVVRCDWCDGELLSSTPDTEVRMCRVCHGKMTRHVTGVREMRAAAKTKPNTLKEKP